MLVNKHKALVCLFFLAVSVAAKDLSFQGIMEEVKETVIDAQELLKDFDKEAFFEKWEQYQSKNPNKMDFGCMAIHCPLKLPAVMIEPKFY